MKKLENDSKMKLIDDLISNRIEDLSKINGGTTAIGCSTQPIGCGPGYCVGDCPAACLNYCMAQPNTP